MITAFDSPNPAKREESALAAKHMAEYLARGGKVQEIPSGVATIPASESLHAHSERTAAQNLGKRKPKEIVYSRKDLKA